MMTVRDEKGGDGVLANGKEVGWPIIVQKLAEFVSPVVRINKQRKIVSDGRKNAVIAKSGENG